MSQHMLSGIRVVELGDEQIEYTGLVLGGLGAEVTKIEPPEGGPSRTIGPFYEDVAGPERSLFFWHYNRGKRSVALDLSEAAGRDAALAHIARADLVIESGQGGAPSVLGIDPADLRARYPGLITVRLTPFGDTGPWSGFQACDLVHLALGGQVMNCGYDPRPDGTYDLPPVAGQMWHAYHVAGENLVMSILAALYHRGETGEGQHLDCAVHEAAAKNTEVDLMSWVMRRAPVYRQTCRHAQETVGSVPMIHNTKDGRWLMMAPSGVTGFQALAGFLESYGMPAPGLTDPGDGAAGARDVPGTAKENPRIIAAQEAFQRLARKFTYADFPWKQAQDAGIMCVPLRRPEENAQDPHWWKRGTYHEVEHPEHGRAFTYVTGKWLSSATEWRVGDRAPLLNEHGDVPPVVRDEPRATTRPRAEPRPKRRSLHGKPFALAGVRILDFGWFLASAGGTRFLAAMGAEVLKVEWAAHPDTRFAAMAPVGGRAAREKATEPLPGVTDPDMGGQFNNKNSGKRGISLNVRHPRGLEIAKRLVAWADVVTEGFSPGVMDRWGLGYDVLRGIKPDIIYAQQSGMGAYGDYGRFRAIGPIAASLAGTSEMSGLPAPAMPAGWGYSYLDWVGAYNFASAVLAALNHRQRTGQGQWIDASQTEAGMFVGGTALLDWSANGRSWQRYGNRSPYRPAAPHGIYRCAGTDRWIAIGCFTDAHWTALTGVLGVRDSADDPRFGTLTDRLSHQDELDALVTEATATRDRYDLMAALQAAGVPAGVCQTAEDRVDTDPQLRHRGWLTEVTGTKIGRWPVAELSVGLSATPNHIGGPLDRGAPTYGEDNAYVYGEILGMTAAEIDALYTDGVIE